MFDCLDLASVEVIERFRGKGRFTTFLGVFEQKAKEIGRAVFVESVMDQRLQNFLIKRRYKQDARSAQPAPNFYKLNDLL